MGRFTADLGVGVTDIWANDISDENLKRTKLDDTALGNVQEQVERFNSLTAKLADPTAYQGALTKADFGTLILLGVNTYSGETRIDAGLLVLDRHKPDDENIMRLSSRD